VFTEEPEGLWSGVLRRKGPRYRLLASMPLDPSMN
jgi:putative transcriptional regulator